VATEKRLILRSALPAALVFAAAWAFHRSYAGFGIAPFDEGILIDGAWRILRGEHFGREFLAPYGPLPYHVLALWFAIFEPSVATFRELAVVLQSVGAVLLFLAAWRLARLEGALLAAGCLILAHGSWHKSFLQLAVALQVYAASCCLDSLRIRTAAGLGLAAAVAFLCRYDVGGFAMLASGVAIIFRRDASARRRIESLASLCSAFLLVVGGVYAILAVRGLDLVEWWFLTWQRILAQEWIDAPFPRPWTRGFGWGSFSTGALFVALATAALCYLGSILGVALRALWRRRDGADPARLCIALLGLCLTNQTRLIPSSNHFFQGALPLYLLASDLLSRNGRPWWIRLWMPVFTALLFLWVLRGTSGLYPASFTARIEDAIRLELPTGRAGVRIAAADAAVLETLVKAVLEVTADGESIATSPRCPLVAFLCDRPLAQPFAEPSYYYRNARYQQRVIEALDRTRPRIWVHDPRAAATFVFPEAAPLLFEYFTRHYRAARAIGPYSLFMRAD